MEPLVVSHLHNLRSPVTVRWEHLLPAEFADRLQEMPVVYLPMGLCEPHGHIAPFGLDTMKAEYLCNEAAMRFGGIVAPTVTYHVHESGYHAPWLEEVIGSVNPRLAALPPHIVLETFLFQLRAFHNAGFRAVVAISGHAGGNQYDLRTVADTFATAYPIEHFVCADPELVAGRFSGDHAGKFEVSQLLAIRRDLIRMERLDHARDPDMGRLGQNADAGEATAELGAAILQAQIEAIGKQVSSFELQSDVSSFITMEELNPLWSTIAGARERWKTTNL